VLSADAGSVCDDLAFAFVVARARVVGVGVDVR
jgi:hypothetical protein